MSSYKPFSFLFLASLLCSSSVLAEPSSKSGRLADGRAYRIDSKGYKLVDHIAELEVNIDDLKRQVLALENELEEKNAIISGQGGTPPKEETLIEAQKVYRPAAAKQSCDVQTAPLKLKIVSLENQLKQKLLQKTSSSSQQDQQKIRELHDQVVRLQNALQESPSKEQLAAKERREQQLASKLQRTEQLAASKGEVLANAKQNLAQREETISTLQQKLSSQTAKVEDLAEELKKKEREILAKNAEVRSLREEQTQLTKRVETLSEAKAVKAASSRSVKQPARGALKAARITQVNSRRVPAVNSAAIRMAKKELNAELKQIQKLISKRKQLIDKLKRTRKGIALSISPLVSKRGDSLDSLRLKTSRMDQSTNLSSLRRGISDIKKLLSEDTILLTRMTK